MIPNEFSVLLLSSASFFERWPRGGCGCCRAALCRGMSVFERRPRYVYVPEKGVALFEQEFRRGACGATESTSSRHSSGMYTYLDRRSKTRTPSSRAARKSHAHLRSRARRHSRCAPGVTHSAYGAASLSNSCSIKESQALDFTRFPSSDDAARSVTDFGHGHGHGHGSGEESHQR